jgi:triosephosphate isomerase (TIM)
MTMVEADPAARKPLISGNWKMHLNHFEATALVQRLVYELAAEDYAAVDVSVHPPFTDIRTVQTYFLAEKDPVPIAIGAQNCHWDEKGAYTGEVSPAMLAKLDVRYVIAGHSERRELFGESDDVVNRKVRAIFQWDMTPILCVGETLEEREAGTTQAKVTGQVEAGLSGLTAEQVAQLVIAYEPIWAIGTGRTATPEDAQAVCATVRDTVHKVAGAAAGEAVRIQYGGSVRPENTADLMACPDIDGALVGGASLETDSFAAIVRYRDRA